MPIKVEQITVKQRHRDRMYTVRYRRYDNSTYDAYVVGAKAGYRTLLWPIVKNIYKPRCKYLFSIIRTAQFGDKMSTYIHEPFAVNEYYGEVIPDGS